MSKYYPIVLFTYKRLSVTRKVVQALLQNPECVNSDLIIFSDGAKNDEAIEPVKNLRLYLQNLRGFKNIELVFRETNFGLANSFIAGITYVLSKFEAAIFMEDDNLVAPCFLAYMNTCLELYIDNNKVSCVTGYSFPLCPNQNKSYFVRGAETWSVGIWSRSWKLFVPDSRLIFSRLYDMNLVSKFSRDGFGFLPMLRAQARGEIDSWGVRWFASMFLEDMYCLYPHSPLCVSIGYGKDSVHCTGGFLPIYRRPHELVNYYDTSQLPDVVKQTFYTSFLIILMNFFINRLKTFFFRLHDFASLSQKTL